MVQCQPCNVIQQKKQVTPPSLTMLALETRVLVELGAFLSCIPLLRNVPTGDGHPVLVFPGFCTGDWSTLAIRWFLKDRGYAVYGWRLGHNLGLNKALEAQIVHRLMKIYEKHQRKVSLVGWSLGGIYARELARVRPEYIRSVVTMGTPFAKSFKNTNIWKVYEYLSGHRIDDFKTEMMDQLKSELPVPTTSIYSQTDGIVSYDCSLQTQTPISENLQVPASHCGMVCNPLVLYVIADRLAQPENNWRPFDCESGLRKYCYQSTLAESTEPAYELSDSMSQFSDSYPVSR
ncbi:MAG: alpha/beta hydrolase [Desulfobacterales bacterium]|nr:alpha/beta hydrolase [Desulfobacterales bacterium]